MAFARVFTGRGSEQDADLVIQELDYMVTSTKVTPDSHNNRIQPDPTACIWQAGNLSFVNQIHNMIRDGLDAERGDFGEEEYDPNDGYSNDLRGIE